MTDQVKGLFQHMLWATAASNVLWSFVSLLVSDQADTGLQLIILGLLAFYLIREWMNQKLFLSPDLPFWVADVALIFSVSAFAIHLPQSKSLNPAFLYPVFCVPCIGHLLGLWSAGEPYRVGRQLVLAASSGVGALIFAVHDEITPICSDDYGAAALAIASMVLCWVYVRCRVYRLDRPVATT